MPLPMWLHCSRCLSWYCRSRWCAVDQSCVIPLESSKCLFCSSSILYPLYVTPPLKSVLPYFCQQLGLSSELTDFHSSLCPAKRCLGYVVDISGEQPLVVCQQGTAENTMCASAHGLSRLDDGSRRWRFDLSENIQGGPKNWHTVFMAITLSTLTHFS